MSNKQEGNTSGANAAGAQIDPHKAEHLVAQLRDRQNLALGALAGAAAALAGAGIWAGFTIVTNYQLGLIAIAVGCAVGLTVRKFGQGLDKIFGIIGAAEAFLGCLVGNLLTVCAAISHHESIPFLVVLSRLTPDLIVSLLTKTFDVMDLVFYAIATYEGYKFSFRKLTPAELASITIPSQPQPDIATPEAGT
jgi:hypothetical protein